MPREARSARPFPASIGDETAKGGRESPRFRPLTSRGRFITKFLVVRRATPPCPPPHGGNPPTRGETRRHFPAPLPPCGGGPKFPGQPDDPASGGPAGPPRDSPRREVKAGPNTPPRDVPDASPSLVPSGSSRGSPGDQAEVGEEERGSCSPPWGPFARNCVEPRPGGFEGRTGHAQADSGEDPAGRRGDSPVSFAGHDDDLDDGTSPSSRTGPGR